MKATDNIGKRYGRWLVIKQLENLHGRRQFQCRCDCGTHGHSGRKNPTYYSWQAMRRRCLYSKERGYPSYGGKGITVCERWDKFENFLKDMGERPEGTTIDRYPNRNGNYEPSNCRWATPTQQGRNRDATKLTADKAGSIRRLVKAGISQKRMARINGVHPNTVHAILTGRTWKEC